MLSIKNKKQNKKRLLLLINVILVILVIWLIAHDFIVKNNITDKDVDLPIVKDAVKIINNNSNNGVDERKITNKQKLRHIVPEKDPRYLTLKALGIEKARILNVGRKKNNQIDTPKNIFDVGWFNETNRQGEGGVIMIDGHNGGPNLNGIFKKLPTIGIGSIVTLERGDGKISNYKVQENYNILVNKFSKEHMLNLQDPINNKETLVIITCTGDWISKLNTYDKRNIVRAVLQ